MQRATLSLLIALALPAWPAAAASPAAAPAPAAADLLLGESYRIELSDSFPAALLHWLDSLADLQGPGMTAGKTVDAHRLEFRRTFGEPTAQDDEMLRRFARSRLRLASGAAGTSPHALTLAFFEASAIAEALATSAGLLGPESEAFRESIAHFAQRYRRIWRRGRLPQTFRESAAAEPRREELAQFLRKVERFYGAFPVQPPHPRLIVVPVLDGFGTHAQAIGRFLLIEVRPGEELLDEVAPLVHENAHFLFQRMAPSRRQALEDFAAGLGSEGQRAWRLLHEALPTAIAQGVADESFRGQRWSMQRSWYHIDAVDTFAKRIYALVKEALAGGAQLDEQFLRRALALEADLTPR